MRDDISAKIKACCDERLRASITIDELRRKLAIMFLESTDRDINMFAAVNATKDGEG